MQPEISLPCFGIRIMLTGDGGGAISSDLHPSIESDEECAAWDAIESLILAHACAGVDVTSLAYIEGLETAIDAIENNL